MYNFTYVYYVCLHVYTHTMYGMQCIGMNKHARINTHKIPLAITVGVGVDNTSDSVEACEVSSADDSGCDEDLTTVIGL